ncbi:hypothetical protein KZY59_10890 [Prevotella buccae]|uniref:hypothetical protein n=1 Tax=Segatella buccae TaxID=28126 RepID=UPI001C5CCCB2|nr:hypothetical protein [Segatella buccae]MBW4872036.1 hypothetical protein [Segatella buccae]
MEKKLIYLVYQTDASKEEICINMSIREVARATCNLPEYKNILSCGILLLFYFVV